jgi:hypothetical protein
LDNPIYTIGHSDHTIETFLSLLQKWNVNAVADVRSSPYSKRHPQFSKAPLEALLRKGGITYVSLGKELGARPSDREPYTEGKADLPAKSADSTLFRKGIHRLLEGRKRWSIAVMCAERNLSSATGPSWSPGLWRRRGAHGFSTSLPTGPPSSRAGPKKGFSPCREERERLFLTPEEMLSAVYRLQEEKLPPESITSNDQGGS